MHPCHTKRCECQQLQCWIFTLPHHVSPNVCSFCSNQDSNSLSNQLPKEAYSSGEKYLSLFLEHSQCLEAILLRPPFYSERVRTNASYKQHSQGLVSLMVFLGQQSSNFLSQDSFILLKNIEDPKGLFCRLCLLKQLYCKLKWRNF